MKIYLSEYNVLPKIEERDILAIKIEENSILLNGKTIDDTTILNKISDLLLSYKKKLLEIKDIKHSNYKGGRQSQLKIVSKEICEGEIFLIGNTSNTEIANFYIEFRNKLINLLK